MVLGKRDIEASASPVEEIQPQKKVRFTKNTKKPSTASKVSTATVPIHLMLPEEMKIVVEPATGAKRKADVVAADANASGQPKSKRPHAEPSSGEEEEGKPKKKKKRSSKKRKNRNLFTSADEPLPQQVIDGTVPEGTAVPDRVRRKILTVAMRIVYNERIGDHTWEAREGQSFQRGGTEAQKVGDRSLPLYHAIADAAYGDELIERMMQAYVAVHQGAVDGLWGKRAHNETYPPPLWYAVIHGRRGVVDALLRLGARPDRLRFGNLEHLLGREPLTAACRAEHVAHERCSLRARWCCDMYNYLAWSVDRLFESRSPGPHADFDAHMDAVEECMLRVLDQRPDWIPRYDSSGSDGKAFFIAPLVNAGFFRMLDRLGVREGMSANNAQQGLENFIRDIKWSRKAEAVLVWFQALPSGRGVRIESRDFQRMLVPFPVKRDLPGPGVALVQVESERERDDVYARVGAILAAWAGRLPRLDELDDGPPAVSSQTYRAWASELAAMDLWLWQWLVELASLPRHGNVQLAKSANALMSWHSVVVEWASAQKADETKEDDAPTGDDDKIDDTKDATAGDVPTS
ncbi:hypothetical protein PG994_013200 [Apiospora phragmitis]|uniref:Uncharacterized protein n=1 Tax=Apiospora phragmitis TaxID=2905665 RepID=A0ABR1T7Z5_9PEZI